MTLTRRDVENIAHLARLEITEAELPVYVGSLSAILAFVEQLCRRGDGRRVADGAPPRRTGAVAA